MENRMSDFRFLGFNYIKPYAFEVLRLKLKLNWYNANVVPLCVGPECIHWSIERSFMCVSFPWACVMAQQHQQQQQQSLIILPSLHGSWECGWKCQLIQQIFICSFLKIYWLWLTLKITANEVFCLACILLGMRVRMRDARALIRFFSCTLISPYRTVYTCSCIES